MPKALPITDFLDLAYPIIDVRSPGEFLRGSIPGAHSLPLFTNEERAYVGTTYKKDGRDAAVLEGLRYVGPRLAQIVEHALTIAPDGRIKVHCWRGGERSGSVAWLLEKAGFRDVITLKGGYKAFRRHVIESFISPVPLRILGGYTGSGKTVLLDRLKKEGEQTIDLEAFACHKGSSFGALGQAPQPTTEHFENLLWKALRYIDRSRPVWVEDESLMIGRVRIPDAFYAQMRKAPLLFIDMPVEQRAARLAEEYGGHATEELGAAIQRISKRLGPQHAKSALEALEMGDLLTAATITLRYYDKAYLRGSNDRDPALTTHMPLSAVEIPEFTQRLREHVIDRNAGTDPSYQIQSRSGMRLQDRSGAVG